MALYCYVDSCSYKKFFCSYLWFYFIPYCIFFLYTFPFKSRKYVCSDYRCSSLCLQSNRYLCLFITILNNEFNLEASASLAAFSRTLVINFKYIWQSDIVSREFCIEMIFFENYWRVRFKLIGLLNGYAYDIVNYKTSRNMFFEFIFSNLIFSNFIHTLKTTSNHLTTPWSPLTIMLTKTCFWGGFEFFLFLADFS